jgi:hypothetical protein
MAELNKRRATAILAILNTISGGNLVLMDHTIRAIQTFFPTVSTQILNKILSTASLILAIPTIYVIYKLSHQRAPENPHKKNVPKSDALNIQK